MKVFLSCDMEGTNGICDWDETELAKADYARFANRMLLEVKAACEGINSAAPDSGIVIKDAHDYCRNLDHSLLPRNTTLIRGSGSSPYSMMHGIDAGFDAAMFTGYHSGGGYDGNPLAHTMSPKSIFHMRINGVLATEFLMN
jgi:D-amino peptidase